MGSSTSKAAKTAAGAARRQYPQRVSPPPTSNAPSAPPPPAGQPTAPGPTVHPRSQASNTRDESINLDASDPDFARSLRSLGPVQPSSTLSNSSTFSPSPSPPSQGPRSSPNQSHPQIFPDPSKNPALMVLTARERLQQQAEVEFAKTGRGHGGKSFLDVSTIRQLLVLRDERGMGGEEIEKRLGLANGVVGRLGPRGVVGDVRIGKVDKDDAGIYG
ncbi:hypothetical protein HO133_008496 [Letharia lupina]|uniref:Helix-turn-helix domain-containing protein n=2 Tax=Letharia TaxID=112415 RepID=A0A8H6CNR1_9LECA|nr:uncharacterized protein HO133_008496 [Letharia lupina]XP_037161401.1 uncharacterized protein HO173_009807 [Letharia columbiana]KAF6227055.1 hypothetical protein HO133_008496 [Letharia lupina]KAF6231970.1 hypothetical protein HO173_009807 [Letharia columbiana]